MKELKKRIEAQIERLTTECRTSEYNAGIMAGLKFAIGCIDDSIRRRNMFSIQRENGGSWSVMSSLGFQVIRNLQTEATAQTACDKLNGVEQ